MELLRYYCLGDRACELELLSDPSVNFPSKYGKFYTAHIKILVRFGTVNYEDPNYNVAMPVFVIHGNHDDPSGDGNLSPIDILATAGLVNYFGKTASVDDINIVPILLKKGDTRLALYGLGGIRDERLHRTFLQKKVKMMRPIQEESWFNMMILHQNRVPHGPTNYIPETFLDDFLDLVVWGHEHESMACDPTECTQRGFMVCQPGSSVATSLCEGEARRKHVVILQVTGTSFETIAIPLKTVRPFVVRDLALREAVPRLSPNDSNAINEFLVEQVNGLIEEAKEEWTERNPETEFPLPLIRLRVDCGLPLDEDVAKAYAIINPQRFGQQFVSKLANPRDILHYLRRRGGLGAAAAQRRLQNAVQVPAEQEGEAAEKICVEDLVSQYLGCQKLDVFPQNEFGDILRTSIEKTDHGLIEKFVNESIGRVIQRTTGVLEDARDTTRLKSEFERVKRQREEEWNRLHPTIDSVLLQVGETPIVESKSDDSGDEDEGKASVASSTRGRGRGRGAAAATSTRARGRGSGAATAASTRTKRAAVELVSDHEDEDDQYKENKNNSDDDAICIEDSPPKRAAPKKKALDLEPAASPKARATKAPASTAWPPRRR